VKHLRHKLTIKGAIIKQALTAIAGLVAAGAAGSALDDSERFGTSMQFALSAHSLDVEHAAEFAFAAFRRRPRPPRAHTRDTRSPLLSISTKLWLNWECRSPVPSRGCFGLGRGFGHTRALPFYEEPGVSRAQST
jgi:hypothetical protein